MTDPLLTVENLSVAFPLPRGRTRQAVDGVSFTIAEGQTLGLVGESGSGKSTLARAIVGLVAPSGGAVTMRQDIASGRHREIQMVFQDPYSSLDPTKTIGYSVAEPLRRHRTADLTNAEITRRTGEILEQVGVPASAAGTYPAQFSGGQRQRIAIARALIVQPRLVICDEALSALDLSVQAQVINLLTRFRQTHGISYLFISHDLSVVEMLCDEVLVLYRGRVAEQGPASAIRTAPQHPYTRGLVAAVPEVDPAVRARSRERRELLRTPVAPMPKLGDSCQYTNRCVFATELCHQQRPASRPTGAGSIVACHRTDEVAARLDAGATVATGGVHP